MKAKLFNRCLRKAYELNTPKHPEYENYIHFSFLIRNNEIVNYGMNKKAEPFTYLGYPSYSKMHSEVDVYFRSRPRLRKDDEFEIVNIRLSRDGRIRNSTPCNCCSEFLKKLGCKTIYFTVDSGEFARIIFGGTYNGIL